ncbi:MAG: glutaminyl-peptide cyclotransferase [Bacteroidales bacterium]|nr:glutaminyl-peptide cyclotransferase [Bacteroidales bacterium]
MHTPKSLIFHDNKLFESTGSPEDYPYTRSVIGIFNLKTGQIDVRLRLIETSILERVFSFLKNKLYQLTYKNQLGFIYDSKDFKQIGTFKYINKEGWV